jgi:GAF domain-containing protein
MECRECLKLFEEIGNALNAPMDTPEYLSEIAGVLVRHFGVAGCLIRLLSRDRRALEEFASYGLSDRFLRKGPVDPEVSAREAVEGKAVVIHDCATDPRIQYPAAHAEEGFQSVVIVPLSTRGQTVGVLKLYAKDRREFGPADLEILEVVASFCASAAVHAMFHKVLRDINKTVRSSLELKERLAAIVSLVTEDLRIRGTYIQLVEASGALSPRCFSFGLSAAFLESAVRLQGSWIGEVLGGKTVGILDATRDPRIAFGEDVEKEGVTSMLFLPLRITDRPMGMMVLCTHRAYPLSRDESALLRSIGDECALAIQNALAYAAMKKQYDTLIEDFRSWVGQSGGYFPIT